MLYVLSLLELFTDLGKLFHLIGPLVFFIVYKNQVVQMFL